MVDFQIRFVIKNLYSFLIIALLNIFASFSQNQGSISGEIYDSNRYTLHAMLSRLNTDIVDMGVVKDDKNLLAEETHARELGIQGVPCFIINKEIVLFGAQDKKIFLDIFNKITNEY